MPNPRELLGKRFGKLVVVGRECRKGRGFWVCRCDCGGEIAVRDDRLGCGKYPATQCGCEPSPRKATKGKPRGPSIDLVGRRFMRLVVVEHSHWNGRSHYWRCQCDCGKEVVTLGSALRSGHTRSCGCYHREKSAEQAIRMGHANFIHGAGGSPEHTSWRHMWKRCTDPESEAYKWYGAAGVTICERWREFPNFLADMGKKPGEDYTLDRIDPRGNYEPSNCRWATHRVQQRNRRWHRLITFRGETKCMGEWAEIVNLPLPLLWCRIENGWPVDEAMTTPSSKGNAMRRKYKTPATS